MKTFSTWAFYVDQYHGTLTQELYNRYAPDAYGHILRGTHRRALYAPESMAEQLAQCECRIIDIVQSYEGAANSILPRGINSMSNDGYSVSRSARGGSTETGDSDQTSDIYDAMQLFLYAPVNLLATGIGSIPRGCPRWRKPPQTEY